MTENFQIEKGILRIAAGTEYLESEKFSEREDIRRVILPEGLRHISVACFASCENLEEINIPSTVKTIDDGAFLSCSSLREISLPEGLEEIADLSFQDSGLEAVTVPRSVKRIGEEAFFNCGSLKRADVLGKDTIICEDAFGSDYCLTEGYIAPGYPREKHPGSELLYSLLYASCPEKHGEETARRAEAFIRSNEELIMERVLKFNNIPAMTGISKRKLLKSENIDRYVRRAGEAGQTEITALLIKAKTGVQTIEEEFEL